MHVGWPVQIGSFDCMLPQKIQVIHYRTWCILLWIFMHRDGFMSSHTQASAMVQPISGLFWNLQKQQNHAKTSVLKVLERNAFLAHPESILLSMLADEDQSVRGKAVNLIANKSPLQERNFVLPKLKAGAPTYHEMIDKKRLHFLLCCRLNQLREKLLRSRYDWRIFRVKELNELFLLLHKQPTHRLATKEDTGQL